MMDRLSIANSGNRLARLFLMILASFMIIACSQTTTNNSSGIIDSQGGFSAPLPSSLTALYDCATELTANLIMDGDTANPISLNVDCTSGTVTGSVDGLTPGAHTFLIQYFINGILVAEATATADVVVGDTPTPVNFTTIDDDLDDDGISGPDEVDSGTDPNDNASIPQAPDGVIDTPVADTTISVGDSVNFTATVTDPDSTVFTFDWNFGGGAANQTVEDPGAVTFNNPGIFTVTFTVTDNLGLVDPTPDSQTITVNGPPVADAGSDQTVGGSVLVTLDGTGSSDPNVDDTLSYSWTQTVGSPVSLSDPTVVQPTFTSPILLITEVLTFELTVSDGIETSTATVNVTVSLTKGSFVKTVVLPTAGGDWFNILWSAPTRNQLLVIAADIGGSGMIDSMSFQLSGVESGNDCSDFTINLVHTDLSDLTTAFDNNHGTKGSPVTVLANSPVSVPAGVAGDYFNIPFSQPFDYNGVDNLIVETRSEGCTGISQVQAGSAAAPYTAGIFATGSATATGLTWDFLPHMKFGFTGGEDSIIYPGSTSGNVCPFRTFDNCRKIQLLYRSTDINGSGPITGVAMIAGDVTIAQTYTATVKLGHSTLDTLTTDFAGNFSDTPIIVANALEYKIPAGVQPNSKIWLPLPDETFIYNGTDNLILEIDVTEATGDFKWQVVVSGGGGRAFAPFGSDTATGMDSFSYNAEFRFHGGTMDVITAENTADSLPFFTSEHKRQFLYLATELGTGGPITSVACRLAGDSMIADYPNFEVVLGHTALTALSNTIADNMDDPTVVFSDIFSIPVGLSAGDWIRIPLTTPFIYDPTMNLVVEMASDSGTAGQSCLAGGPDATLYLQRHLFVFDRTALTGTRNNFLVDLQLGFSE